MKKKIMKYFDIRYRVNVFELRNLTFISIAAYGANKKDLS